MTKDPKTYTHDELVEVLQRSIALSEAAKDRPYTDADLVAAAKELDVEPEMVRKAQAELERRRAARSLAPRTHGKHIGTVVMAEILIFQGPLRERLDHLVAPGRCFE